VVVFLFLLLFLSALRTDADDIVLNAYLYILFLYAGNVGREIDSLLTLKVGAIIDPIELMNGVNLSLNTSSNIFRGSLP